jgi:alkylhydroperoxidase family enzyme
LDRDSFRRQLGAAFAAFLLFWRQVVAWIKTIPENQAEGELRREYEAAIRRAGRVWNIVKLMSLNPSTLRASMDVYVAAMHGASPLTRAQREMLAVVVSRANDCHY